MTKHHLTHAFARQLSGCHSREVFISQSWVKSVEGLHLTYFPLAINVSNKQESVHRDPFRDGNGNPQIFESANQKKQGFIWKMIILAEARPKLVPA